MKIRTRFPIALVATALAGAWSSPPAFADGTVDLELRSGDKVSGTLRPASEQELFRGSMPGGAQLVASLKAKRKTASPISLQLRRDGIDVAGAVIAPKGSAVVLQPFTAQGSGTYELVVVGNGSDDTDYDFSLSWKPLTKFSLIGNPVAAAATDSFNFSAPAGAVATIDVLPEKGSAFVAGLVGVTGPSGYSQAGGAGTRMVTGTLPATGDYNISFRNDGAAEGRWIAKFKLKLAKATKAKIDIRDGSTTGAFGSDHTAFGRVLGPDGGTVDAPLFGSGPLEGTSVTIPAGTLGAATTITVSSAPPLSPGGGSFGAGPAVEFGPEGTVFDPTGSDPSKQATITIPFDPSFFPNGTSSLRIYVRAAGGATTEVPPPYVFNGNTVSFTTSHFSTYQATGSGTPPLVGRFLMIELAGDANSNFSGVLGFGLNRFDAQGSTAFLSIDEARVAWDNVPGMGAAANLQQTFDGAGYDITVSGDGRVSVIDPQDPANPVATLRRSPSGNVLVGDGIPLVALRVAGGDPTMTTIAGKWHVFHFGVDGRTQNGQPPTNVSIGLDADSGTITLKPDGTTSFASFRSFEADTVFPFGAWAFVESPPPTGLTWTVEDNDVVSVNLINAEDGRTIRLTAVLDGDVLVGRPSSFAQTSSDGNEADLFILVRASSSATIAGVAGNYIVSGQEVETEDRGPASVQGVELRYSNLTASISKTGALSVSGFEDTVTHDGLGEPVRVFNEPVPSFSGRFALRSDGWLTDDAGAVGAFSRSGELFIRAQFDGRLFSILFGGPISVATGK